MKRFFTILFFLVLVQDVANATGDTILFPHRGTIAMRPYFTVIEDEGGEAIPQVLLDNPALFGEIGNFNPRDNQHTFWLFTHLQSFSTIEAVISFRHLSYADLYLIADTAGAKMIHQSAGAFQSARWIRPGDSRFHFRINLTAGIRYKLLIQSRHTKQYDPVFDFDLDDQLSFSEMQQEKDMVNFIFLGAELLLLLYVFISWRITRYRPYLWLAVSILGLTLYSLTLARYMINWFFPNHPESGWRLLILFMHLALAGLFLLVIEFWRLKEKSPLLFRIGKLFLYGIGLLAIVSFLVNYYTGNFRLTARLNGSLFILQLAYLVSVMMLWKKFNKQERFLAYGVIIYLLITIVATVGMFVYGEPAYDKYVILSGSNIIVVSLFFLTGITGKLRQDEKDKNRYLSQLNQLKTQQNELLEINVAERTRELNERNEHIELLMNELNHRVKNNLQLLYSLNGLQLKGNKDTPAGNILRDNISRIKAMMLVNDRLNPGNNSAENSMLAGSFIMDIVEHSRTLFTRTVPAEIKMDIDSTLVLDATEGLCLGLIITELLTNSNKHAFAGMDHPQIHINISRGDGYWEMEYRDNGSGFVLPGAQGFGSSLIADLTRQMKGEFRVDGSNGASYHFKFPLP